MISQIYSRKCMAMAMLLTGVIILAIAVNLPATDVPVDNLPPSATTEKQPATDSQPKTGAEKVRATPYSFLDAKFGATVSVFEAVPTGDLPAVTRLYLSPICRLVPFDTTGKKYEATDLGNGTVRVSVRMQYYYEDLFAEAALKAASWYPGQGIKREQIALLAVSVVQHELHGFPAVRPYVIGDFGSRVNLPAAEVVSFDVPSADMGVVEKLAASQGGLRIDTRLTYNAVDVAIKLLRWTAEHIQNSNTFKSMATGGGNFVSAEQVQTVVMEAAVLAGVFQYEDPDVPGEVDARAMEFFYALLADAKKITIDSLQKAAEADELLRRGTGLKAEDYQPVQLSFKYSQEVLTETDYKKANDRAEAFYFREQTKLSVSAKAKWGPVSGRASYNRDTDRIEHQAYETQEEYERFQHEHRAEEGQGVRFEPRGLGLAEKSQFLSKAALAAQAVKAKPNSSVKRLVVSSTTTDGAATFARWLLQQDVNGNAIADLQLQHRKAIADLQLQYRKAIADLQTRVTKTEKLIEQAQTSIMDRFQVYNVHRRIDNGKNVDNPSINLDNGHRHIMFSPGGVHLFGRDGNHIWTIKPQQ